MNRHAPIKVLRNKEVKEKQINHGKIKKLVKICKKIECAKNT